MDLAKQAKIVDSIHDTLHDFVGQRLKVRANMGRSKIVESEGVLTQVHPQLFIMEVDRKRGRTARQSYQYVDVLTGMVELSQNGEPLFDAADHAAKSDAEIRRSRLHFGMVFQSFNLFPQYTALENVMLAPLLLAKEQPDYKKNKREIHEQIEHRAIELLEMMSLEGRMSHYPHQLSGGQQQRVAIARALALKPDILCFDEPTSALDPELTGEVLRVIRSLADQHTTMIIVTHEMAFARDVADHVVFMDGGTIVEEGTPTEVFENTHNERTKAFLSRFSQNS